MKHIGFNLQWHARKGGGLFLGVRLDFPCYIFDMERNSHYTLIKLKIGLLLFTLNIDIMHSHKKALPI